MVQRRLLLAPPALAPLRITLPGWEANPSPAALLPDRQQAWLQDPRTQAPADVERRIGQGLALIRRLRQGPTQQAGAAPQSSWVLVDPVPIPDDLINAVWALAARAARDGEPFYEGAFTLFDGSSHNAHTSQGTIAKLMQHVRETPTLYRRLSSHLPAFKDAEVWGMDVHAARDGAVLPGGRRHLLVHLVQDAQWGPFIYLKAEHHGTQDPMDFVRHGIGYVQSLGRRWMGGNDGPQMRKERVPKGLIARFGSIVRGNAEADHMMAQVRGRGVSAAAAQLELLMQAKDAGAGKRAGAYLHELREQYTHIDRRIGRERIELLSALSLRQSHSGHGAIGI